MYPHDATLEFAYDTEREARTITDAVSREIGEIDDDRSRTTISREGDSIVLNVFARDLTALRAACNTWFSLVTVAERTATIGKQYLDTSVDPSAGASTDTEKARSDEPELEGGESTAIGGAKGCDTDSDIDG